MATSRAALALALATVFIAFANAYDYPSPPVAYPSPAYTPSPPTYNYDDFVGNWTGVCYSKAVTKDGKWSSCLTSPISQTYWASITKEGSSYYYTWYLEKTVTYDHDDSSKTYEAEAQEQEKTLLDFKVAGDFLCVTSGDTSFSWQLEEVYDDKGKVLYKKIYEIDYFAGGASGSTCPKAPYQGLFCDSCTYDFNYHCVLEPVYKYTPKCSPPPTVYPSPAYYPSPSYSPSPEYYPSPLYTPSPKGYPSPSPYRKML